MTAIRETMTLSGAFSEIEPTLPTLRMAQQIGAAAAREGFDWGTPQDVRLYTQGVMRRLAERSGIANDTFPSNDLVSVTEVIGNLIYMVAHLGHWLNLDSEEALLTSAEKFRRRFRVMEQECEQRGWDFVRLEDWQWFELWPIAKEATRHEQFNTASEGGFLERPSALLRAQTLIATAAPFGFEWLEPRRMWAKLEEELAEFDEASGLSEGDPAVVDRAHSVEELGDTIWMLVHIARRMGIDADRALYESNMRFVRRFNMMEALLNEQGRRTRDCDVEELQRLWAQLREEV